MMNMLNISITANDLFSASEHEIINNGMNLFEILVEMSTVVERKVNYNENKEKDVKCDVRDIIMDGI